MESNSALLLNSAEEKGFATDSDTLLNLQHGQRVECITSCRRILSGEVIAPVNIIQRGGQRFANVVLSKPTIDKVQPKFAGDQATFCLRLNRLED